MRTVSIAGIPESGSFDVSVMALGNFDGVHLGHREIIEKAKYLSNQMGVKLAVMTFDPHPRQVLGVGANYDRQLTPLPIKLKAFEKLGVDICYVVQFNKEFAAISSEKFVTDYLIHLNAASIVVGFDYRFGAGGRADASNLKSMAAESGKSVHIVQAVNLYGEKVSSSFIREKLLLGEVKIAAELLGNSYKITGVVARGEGRGRLLGYPTANLAPVYRFVLPRTGVYLVKGKVSDTDEILSGLMNIGYKPTFHEVEEQMTLEAHFFNYTGDLYNREITVEFLDFLRSEKKFNSAQELIDQIQADIMEAKRRLSFA